jgi:hypothetical protein
MHIINITHPQKALWAFLSTYICFYTLYTIYLFLAKWSKCLKSFSERFKLDGVDYLRYLDTEFLFDFEMDT